VPKYIKFLKIIRLIYAKPYKNVWNFNIPTSNNFLSTLIKKTKSLENIKLL